LIHAAFIASTIVGIRLIGSFIAFYGHLGFKNTLLFALSDSMPLTFMVAAATLGLNAKAIDEFEYSSIVVASMLEAMTIMMIIKGVTSIYKRLN
jgi:Kef-type K+ transport system membrane component KefB